MQAQEANYCYCYLQNDEEEEIVTLPDGRVVNYPQYRKVITQQKQNQNQMVQER